MNLTWSRTRTIVAGCALIVMSNAVALLGVAYNRSGEPESRLQLTQRELSQPFSGFPLERDAVDTTISLNWRVLGRNAPDGIYPGRFGRPEWLDATKLAELGFDVSKSMTDRMAAKPRSKLFPREVFIVLELDGPTYRMALQRAREFVGKEKAESAAGSRKAYPGTPDRSAALQREESSNSRLFAVDAGIDAKSLRAKYPDREHYAILRGRVLANFEGGHWTGYVEGLNVEEINMPIEIRRAVGPLPRMMGWGISTASTPSFQLTVVFGKKFEPWIESTSSEGRGQTPLKE
jgi:hypothetical protein